MMNKKVVTAPHRVIEELDEWLEQAGLNPSIWLMLMDINEHHERFTATSYWVYGDNTLTESTRVRREMAVIAHVFGETSLQIEREPRYYVTYQEGKQTLFVYKGGIDKQLQTLNEGMPPYEAGLSKVLADEIAQEFNGEVKSIDTEND
jgi:hypothetical protein